ncbi:MAG: coproporphyrinogen dehydrogenase HemZ, partial [Vallitaleaceae bacterium]|nr:coproporphyrinogen dehydrogenase HemZ [Vallitaleaceae bacterium]
LVTTFFDRNVVFSSTKEEAQIQIEIKDQEINLFCQMDGETHKPQRKNFEISKDEDYRNRLKRELFVLFQEISKRTPLWGILQGIRPTKLVYKLARNLGLDLIQDREKIVVLMEEEYLLSREKAKLLVQIAIKESAHVYQFNSKKKYYSVYVGIPFCPSRCTYCSFTSNLLSQWESQIDHYVDALLYEIREFFAMMKESPQTKQISSLYIGGGTPTSLSTQQLDRLISEIREVIPFEELQEFTVEAGRPDTITREKLEVLKRHKVNRISINPQTMNQETLDRIGRKHCVDEIVQAMEWAKEIGFERINMDLILGLPGENEKMVINTLDQVLKMEPSDITVHTLAIKRTSDLRERQKKSDFLSREEMQNIMEATTKRIMNQGNYEPYYLYRQKNMIGQLENIGYCKGNAIGKYNIEMMEECIDIIAFGAGSSSKFLNESGVERVENLKNVHEYMERIDELVDRKKAAFFK